MTSDQILTLKRIFSDAHIVDIDLSEWSNQISFWLLADHYREWSGRMPLLKLSFSPMIGLSITSSKVEPPNDHSAYAQWLTHSIEIEEIASINCVTIRVSGHLASPVFELSFEEFKIEEMDHKILDQLAPGWNKPGSPFARRGILQLVQRAQKAKS